MKRARSKAPVRLSKDAERLIAMAASATLSGGGLEDDYWHAELVRLAGDMLARRQDSALESALDQTFQANPAAYEQLNSAIEQATESFMVEAADGTPMQALLFSVPLVAWSKYRIQAGVVDDTLLAPIRAHLHGHVLARDVALCLSTVLYSVDQLPRGFSETHRLLRRMAEAAMADQTDPYFRGDVAKLPDTADFPADARFLIGVAVSQVGAPTFQWQELGPLPIPTRTDVLTRWVEQCRPSLARLVHGAAFECGLPDAYFRNCRECDLRVRPYALSSILSMTASALGISESRLDAVVAGVGETAVDEYRISVLVRGQDQVVNGAVWPLYGNEDDDANPGPRNQIESILAEQKVGNVIVLEGVQKPEFCEDCGAPLFFDRDGVAMHAEMPEDSEAPAAHYH